MKYLQHLIFSIIIFAGIIACKQQTNNENIISYKDFPTEISVTCNQLYLGEDVYLKYPDRIIKNDSLFFILDRHAPEYYVHAFSFPQLKYQFSMCRRGSGPNDFISIYDIQLENDTLFVFSGVNGVVLYKIDTSNENNHIRIGKISITQNYGILTRGKKWKNRLFFSSYGNVNCERIIEIDAITGEFIATFGNYAVAAKDKNTSPFILQQAWSSFLDVKNDLLVTVTQLGEVIDIFNLKDSIQQKTLKGVNKDPVFNIVDNRYAIPEGILGFYDVKIGEKRIYAVFDGTKLKEREETSSGFKDGCKNIYIFDFNGRPVKKINLDRTIMNVFIDEKNEIIYALDIHDDQPLVSISAPEIFE
jgi:hypothetical protein